MPLKPRKDKRDFHHSIMFWLGVLGLTFYAVSPAVLPDTDHLRQPELIPAYTSMMGLGIHLRGRSDDKVNDDDSEKGERHDS